jgi:anthranilate/para-aminobenzoate synthase component I
VPVAVELSAPPQPLFVAHALVQRGAKNLALLHSSEPSSPLGRYSFLGVDPDQQSAALDPGEGDAGEAGQGALPFAPRWIGVAPYEALRAIERPAWRPMETRSAPSLTEPVWLRYPAVVVVDHREGTVTAVGHRREDAVRLAEKVREALGAAARPAPRRLALSVSDFDAPERHLERIVRAKELIFAGELYQVNLARKLCVTFDETPSAAERLALFERLARAAPTPLGACLELPGGTTVLSTSPELLLLAEPSAAGALDRLTTIPIKGTAPRGADAATDQALARALDVDPKERAELTMIIDVERNDLGRVARTGSVRVLRAPYVVAHRTVHHRQAVLVARARPGLSRRELLAAMLPSGSVTGAPKVRAMEVIASLEPTRRGLYTGAIGYVGYDGRLELSMAIRTLVIDGAAGEYLTGGGIVADSDPARELEETRWKAAQLERLVSRPRP